MTLILKQLDLQFDEKEHRYTLNKEWVPGVTTVIGFLPKPWLVPWAAKSVTECLKEYWLPDKKYTKKEIDDLLYLGKTAHTRKKEEAAEKGLTAHDWFEQFIKTGQEPPLPKDKEVQNSIKGFKEWLKNNKVEWLGSEIVVGHEKHRYAGKIDALGKINGKMALIDFKTSSFVDYNFNIQLSGYQLALESMDCPPIEERWILQFPKKGDFVAKLADTDVEEDKEVFLSALKIYRAVKKYENKKK